jgi:hypothetical protein
MLSLVIFVIQSKKKLTMANKVNLFNGPAVKPVKKKAEKRTIEITDAALFNKVVDLVDKNEQIDALSGQAKMLASELKECTIAEFSKAYADDDEGFVKLSDLKEDAGENVADEDNTETEAIADEMMASEPEVEVTEEKEE